MKRTVPLSLLTLVAVAITWQMLPPPQKLVAQKKISQLTEDTSPTSDDLVELTNDPGGTPASRKATLSNLAKGIDLSNAATGTLPVARGGTGVTTSTGTGATVRGTSPDFTTGITLGGVEIPTISSTSSLTNKTITSSTNTLGSVTMDATGTDATGDIYYRDSGGVLTRLGIGSTGQVVTVAGGLPSWSTPGGGLTKFTEAESTSSPNGTVYVDSLTATGASTNADFVVKPKGSGAILGQIPDSTTTGGNKRGAFAVDLQRSRSNAIHVASGDYAFIGAGKNNRAWQPQAAVVAGQSNVAGDQDAIVCAGSFNEALGNTTFVGAGSENSAIGSYSGIVAGVGAQTLLYSQHSQASGYFAAAGDAQTSVLVVRKSTTNATPADMFLDGNSQKISLSNDTTFVFSIIVVARRTDADNESAAYKFEGCIDRQTNAASTALVGSVTKTVLAEDTAAWDCNVTADTTNGAIKVTVTGEASKTIRWVARIELTEVTG